MATGADGRRGKDSLSPVVHYRLAKLFSYFSTITLMALPFFILDFLLPITVNSKPEWNTLCLFPSSPLVNNLILFIVFYLQHSLMARLPWKMIVWKFFPDGFEKSVYALLSGIVLTFMYLFWMPMTEVWFWQFENPWLYYGTVALNVLQWYLILKTMGVLKDADILGVQAAEDRYYGKADSQAKEAKIVRKGFYRFVRHPTMVFQILGNWIAPTMSLGHFIWAGGLTAYIVVAVIFFEEPDLVRELGEDYKTYMKEVPRFVPNPFSRTKSN